MSVQAFKVYYHAKKSIGNTTINLGGGTFDAHLAQSASNFATLTISTLGSLTSQVASGNGYKQSGKNLASVLWSLDRKSVV